MSLIHQHVYISPYTNATIYLLNEEIVQTSDLSTQRQVVGTQLVLWWCLLTFVLVVLGTEL